MIYPAVAMLAYDANFGYWPGAASGPNNGDCSANVNYPLTSPTFPGGYYQEESGTTCQEPIQGVATFTSHIWLGTPEYTQLTGVTCTSQGVSSPCYTVTWTKNHETRQDWDIYLK